MFSKLTNMKLNISKKLFLLTMGIVFLTIFTNFAFNSLFLDKYTIYQKKKTIVDVKDVFVQLIETEDKENLDILFEYCEDKYGIKPSIINVNTKSRKRMHSNKSKEILNSLNIQEGKFDLQDNDSIAGVLFIRYYYRLSEDQLLSLRSSLTLINQQTQDIILFSTLIGIFAFFISLVPSLIFSKYMSRNIISLKNTAEKISLLEYPKNIVIKSGDEIEELSLSLDKMAKDLKISIENLKSFVSNASHELKTPISVLCLYSQALLKGNLDKAKEKEYQKILANKSLEMKFLTESLLILSKINSPDFKINSEKIDLENSFENALETYDYLEFEKDIEVEKNIFSKEIYGDLYLIQIVINNLVQNAFKYSPDSSKIFINFENNLISIINSTSEKIELKEEELFQPFSRGNNANNSKIEGSGLGLSIVKKILDLHNIQYSVNLTENTFEFYMYI